MMTNRLNEIEKLKKNYDYLTSILNGVNKYSFQNLEYSSKNHRDRLDLLEADCNKVSYIDKYLKERDIWEKEDEDKLKKDLETIWREVNKQKEKLKEFDEFCDDILPAAGIFVKKIEKDIESLKNVISDKASLEHVKSIQRQFENHIDRVDAYFKGFGSKPKAKK
jgi:hypothetical protein